MFQENYYENTMWKKKKTSQIFNLWRLFNIEKNTLWNHDINSDDFIL